MNASITVASKSASDSDTDDVWPDTQADWQILCKCKQKSPIPFWPLLLGLIRELIFRGSNGHNIRSLISCVGLNTKTATTERPLIPVAGHFLSSDVADMQLVALLLDPCLLWLAYALAQG